MTSLQLRSSIREDWLKRNLLGSLIGDSFWDVLVSGNSGGVEVYKPCGKLLLALVPGALSDDSLDRAWEPLRSLRTKLSMNRGKYAGGKRDRRVKQDGSLTNTSESVPVASSVIGYYDRYPRIPFCRETAFPAQEVDKWGEVLPLTEEVSDAYRLSCPKHYSKAVRFLEEEVHPDFRIGDTAFTTVTVNYNVRASCHYDAKDFKGGMSVLTVLRRGNWTGHRVVFPKYRAAVNLDHGDLLFFDPHEMHANTERAGEGERISCVFYIRENMRDCGSASEELDRAKEYKGDLKTA
jgi:hypothetical protein